MRPSFLKKYCSYLFPLRQEIFESAVSGTLEVLLFKGRYQLVTKNAVYSFEDLYTSYGFALNTIRNTNIHSVLVLGLGLGSIPLMLQKKLGEGVNITCVELDTAIIDRAETYYPSATAYRKLKIIHSDAYDYVIKSEIQYDLVTVDLFIDTSVPEKFFNLEFLEKLAQLLTPEGIVLFSRLKAGDPLERRHKEQIPLLFPGSIDIETEGNRILYWNKKNTV